MKTHLRTIALALAIVLALAPSIGLAQTSAYRYWWQVVDELGQPYTGQNVTCSVYRPNQTGAAVVHTTAQLTSGGTSPLTSDANGQVQFYSSLNEPVDVTCNYAFGGVAQVNRLRITDHKIIVPRQAGTVVSKFAVNAASATYQTDSGIALPGGAVIRDVIVQNLNPLSLGTYHLSVGFLGNHAVATANALVNQVDLTPSVEWLRPGLVGSAGGGPGAVARGTHRGSALADFHASVCSGGVCGGPTIYREMPYVVHVGSGLTVSYSAQPGTGNALRAHVHIIWQKMHVGVNRQGLTN